MYRSGDDNFAGLPDLMLVRNPARIDCRAAGTHAPRRAHPPVRARARNLRPAHAAPARDDDTGVGQADFAGLSFRRSRSWWRSGFVQHRRHIDHGAAAAGIRFQRREGARRAESQTADHRPTMVSMLRTLPPSTGRTALSLPPSSDSSVTSVSRPPFTSAAAPASSFAPGGRRAGQHDVRIVFLDQFGEQRYIGLKAVVRQRRDRRL